MVDQIRNNLNTFYEFMQEGAALLSELCASKNKATPSEIWDRTYALYYGGFRYLYRYALSTRGK